MARYLWCEDRKSGFQFWKAILSELYPDVIVESKDGNSGLRKAAGRVEPDQNQYYILMDSAMDNPVVLRETKKLISEISEKKNIRSVELHSFELALLSFESLEKWVFAEEDELKDRRLDKIEAKSMLVKLCTSAENSIDLREFKEKFDGYTEKNSEQIAARLLFEITRNTGFETSKGKLGECFINSCCEWTKRQDDDICGLDKRRLNSVDKAKELVAHSILREAFGKAGL